MTTYKTVQGDKWDSIAYAQLGDTKYTDSLIKANPQHNGVYIFESGVEIIIPDVNMAVTADDLPPWKVVSG